MTAVIFAIIGFVVAISVLVAVHEFGHFWVARRLGIKVLRFSIGFGKPIWRREGSDGTEFVVSNLPLGGYVKMLDEREGGVDPSEAHRAFNRQPIWSRIAVLLAGPAFNFVFAVAAYWVLFMVGITEVTPVIGAVAEDGIAAQAGMRVDDVIVSVDGDATPGWKTAQIALLKSMTDDGRIGLQVRGADGRDRDVVLEIGDRAVELTEPGKMFPGLGFSPWSPPWPPVLDQIVEESAAAKAGIQSGDRVVAVAGEAVRTWSGLVEAISARPGESVAVELERGAQRLRRDVTFGTAEVDGRQVGRLGVTVRRPENIEAQYEAAGMLTTFRYGPLGSLKAASVETWTMSAMTLTLVGRIFTGRVSAKNISGPINIAQYAGYSARLGATKFLGFLAIVSISLGLLNLLPIPVLDGGQIVFQLAEWVKGRPLSPQAEYSGQLVGLMLLVALMGFAVFNDIFRLVG